MFPDRSGKRGGLGERQGEFVEEGRKFLTPGPTGVR
jgi:hypothetical protein